MESQNKKNRVIFGLVFLLGVGSGALLLTYLGPFVPRKINETEALKNQKVEYWVDPMDSSYRRSQPGEAPCGMALVPVYASLISSGGSSESGTPEGIGWAPVSFSTWQQQLIGIRLDTAQDRILTRIIRTVGRVAGGKDDFAVAAGDFAAQERVSSAPSRYVVADVDALDFPDVRVGQRAWVSSLGGSGSRLEGTLTRIYPDDQTQSRVRQVRIHLSASLSAGELFDNVEIEVCSKSVLSVPREAVMTTGLYSYVFVEKSPGVFMPTPVSVGFQGENLWQILSGLDSGASVVDGANFMLDSDSQIHSNFEAMDAQTK